MIPLAEAQARLLAMAPDPLTRLALLPVTEAAGRIVLSDVQSLRDQPDHPLSAMDGYAVTGPSPWKTIGEAAAGRPFAGSLRSGEAVRIFTGAHVPDGADTVIMQEDMTRDDVMVALAAGVPLSSGRHIRPRCGDFSAGDTLIEAGSRLTPAQIGLAIAGGHATLPVARPISVAILSTGDELVLPGHPTSPGQIPASNGAMIAALLARPGAIVTDHGIVPDDLDATRKALEQASHADIIVTIGGASVGDHDLVRPALLAAGATLDFWKVAMRPGKPVMAGTMGNAILLGLPGNPVSAYVTAFLFARPLIASMLGEPLPFPVPLAFPIASALPENGNRTDHIRARLDEDGIHPVGLNDSAALSALASATHLIVRTANAPAARAGDFVDVLDLT